MLYQLPHELLICPVCKSKIAVQIPNQAINCTDPACGIIYPVINGIPCLINEKNSVFSFDDFINQKDLFFKTYANHPVKRIIRRMIPRIDKNYKTKTNHKRIAKSILEHIQNPRILVLGGSRLSEGMESIVSIPGMTFIETDVSFGPRTILICDAHDIPFENESFDWVIVQAVLEHVADPVRCVDEIYRVLKPEGLIYAETPFMQQVHGREFDFTRYTFLGHRRILRQFNEIESGIVCGPGMALAWAYKYFLLSFFKSKALRKLANAFTDLTSFYLKYFDRYLINNDSAYDAASGFFFLGKKTGFVISDKEIIKKYKGGF